MRPGRAPRGICQVCGENTAIRDDGALRRHPEGGHYAPGQWWCPGSFLMPLPEETT